MSWPSRIYCATKTLGVYYTGDFADPGTQPTWAAVNTGLAATDVRQFALDPFEPADKQYALLEATRTLYRRDDGGSWAAILTSAQCATLTSHATAYIHWFTLDKSIAGRIWTLIGDTTYGCHMAYSDDYGANWTNTAEVFASSIGVINCEAYGDKLWVSWVIGPGWKGSYSTNKGGSYSQIWTEWPPSYFTLNPLQPDRVYYGEYSSHAHISKFDTARTELATPCGIPRADAIWFSPTDANHHRAVNTRLYTTTDSWATTNAPSAITPVPLSISPWSGADEDQMIVGLTRSESGPSQPHVIGVLYGEDDTTAVGIAGANCETTPFADSIPDTCGGVAIGGVAAISTPEYTTIKLLSLKPTQDRSDYVTRVYPRASGISLAVTTRTASGDYALDAAAGYIVNTAAEALYGRRERPVTFTLDMPTGSDTDDESKVLAANALYDKGLEWLGQHDSIPTNYTAKVTGQTTLIESLTTIHLLTTTTVDGDSVHSLDADFNIVKARNYLNDASKLEADLELSTLEREAVNDAQVMAEAVVNASKPSGGGSVASVSTVVSRVEGTADINAGTIDGTVIGQEDPANATFEDVLVEGDITLVGLLNGFDVSMLDPILEVAGKAFITDGYGGGSYQAVSGSDLTSGASTEGQVLTSDGYGGAAWEDAAGGVGAHDILSATHTDTTVSAPNDNDVLTWDDVAGKWIAQAPAAGGVVDADDVTYTPTVATDWDADTDPGSTMDALDQLAERTDDLETAPPAHVHDAAVVTYTPTTATDWDSDADPGDVDNALDQLAERVDDLEGAGGGGDVATDAIWDARGDLAIGTGANTAAKLAAGTNGKVPVYASGETTGMIGAYPQPQIVTAYANAADAHTANNTLEDINSMSVSITPPFASAKLFCTFTFKIAPVSSNWEHYFIEFDMDAGTRSESWGWTRDNNPVSSSPKFVHTIHTVFEGVSAAAHTIKARWISASSLDCTFTERRLTVMCCQ